MDRFRAAALAFVLAFGLAGVASASDAARSYVLEAPRVGPAAQVELGLSYGGATLGRGSGAAASATIGPWQVTVRLDAVRGRIHCEYRQVRGACVRVAGAELWPPPLATIRLYRDSVSRPDTLVVDPAGIGGQGAKAAGGLLFETVATMPRRFHVAVPVPPRSPISGGALRPRTAVVPTDLAYSSQSFSPLRI